MHYQRVMKDGVAGGAAPRYKGFYVTRGYTVIRRNGRRCLEHRYVMEQHLGRTLLQTETVHHLNGNRSDNRIENLEVWSSHQPKGQRLEDKLGWAVEFLEGYGYRVSAPKATLF